MTHEASSKKLTPVQRKFVKEYVLDFVGGEAYMRASGSTNKKSANVQASKLLKLPKIKEAIDLYVQEQLGPLEKDLIGNVEFWIKVRDSDEESTANRLKAADSLAKYRSMFIEKSEVSLEGTVKIIDDIKAGK